MFTVRIHLSPARWVLTKALVGTLALSLTALLSLQLLLPNASGEGASFTTPRSGLRDISTASSLTAGAGTIAYLPTLSEIAGGSGADEGMVAVQNVGSSPTFVRLDIWGDYSGECPSDTPTPTSSLCSGLVMPNETWYWSSSDFPPASRSGVIQAVSECSDSAVPQSASPLVVNVIRTGPSTPNGSVNITGAYAALVDADLGWPDADGKYRYAVPLAYANAFGLNTWLTVQNAGDACTSVDLSLLAEGVCDAPITTSIATLAPGEAYQLDLSTAASDFQGRVLLTSPQPLAIVADTIGYQALTSDTAIPLDGPSPGQTAGDLNAYAPLIYRHDQGWSTSVTVQNLSPTAETSVTVEFLDGVGSVVDTRTADILCPLGSITFLRPLTDGRWGVDPGWVHLRSSAAHIAGLVTMRKWTGPQFLVIQAVSYLALPASRVTPVSRAFLPLGGHRSGEDFGSSS